MIGRFSIQFLRKKVNWTMDVHALVDGVARLDILELGEILVCVVMSSSLIERIRAHQYDGLHLLALEARCCDVVLE